MDDDTLKALIQRAESDQVARACRVETCQTLAATFGAVGQLLWVGGYVIGPDQAAGQSPFSFGSDASVGLATVVQIAGELTAGAVSLLEQGNLYAAAALVRQLVEVEYVAWAFAEDKDQATVWVRSTSEERRMFWRPHDLRRRSGGRFRAADYARHCDRGGHPTPDAMALLPDHTRRDSAVWWWLDLAVHGVSTWDYVEAAARDFGWADHVRAAATGRALPETIERWRRSDPLADIAKTLVTDE